MTSNKTKDETAPDTTQPQDPPWIMVGQFEVRNEPETSTALVSRLWPGGMPTRMRIQYAQIDELIAALAALKAQIKERADAWERDLDERIGAI